MVRMAGGMKNVLLHILVLLLPIVLRVEGHTHHITFAGLHCKMCPPGTHWVSDCTTDGQQDICVPCPDGYYQSWYNTAYWCVPCSSECPGHHNDSNIEMVSACTNTSNMKCACKEGYRMARHHRHTKKPSCIPVTSCLEGEGVQTKADGDEDTNCVPCVPGYTFSNISSTTEPCMNCSVCGVTEELVTKCTPVRDTVCRLREHHIDKAKRVAELSMKTEMNASERIRQPTSQMSMVILALLHLKSV